MLYHDGKNDAFRTHNINVVFDLTKKLLDYYESYKKKKLTDISELSYSVDVSIQKSNYLYKDLLLFQEFSSAELLR